MSFNDCAEQHWILISPGQLSQDAAVTVEFMSPCPQLLSEYWFIIDKGGSVIPSEPVLRLDGDKCSPSYTLQQSPLHPPLPLPPHKLSNTDTHTLTHTHISLTHTHIHSSPRILTHTQTHSLLPHVPTSAHLHSLIHTLPIHSYTHTYSCTPAPTTQTHTYTHARIQGSHGTQSELCPPKSQAACTVWLSSPKAFDRSTSIATDPSVDAYSF